MSPVSSAKQDLGTGSVKKLLLRLAIPTVTAQIVNLLYNIVDRIYIGHIPEVGGTALTGVGLCGAILTLITAFSTFAGSGGAPRAAIFMGAGDKKSAEEILGNCFTLMITLGVILTGVFYVTAPTLLEWFGGSNATLPYAITYARTYIFGSVFVLIVMGMNPFITTQGYSKFSMITTIIGAVCNIILDPIFIFVLDMGVMGAALATVISQAISAFWVLRFLTGPKTQLKLSRGNLRLSPRVFAPCMGLGTATFIMLSTESILSVCFTSSLYRYGGDLAVGAMTILTSIRQLVHLPIFGICQGGQPIIGFNYGAKKYSRVREAHWCQFFACLCYGIVFWAMLMLFPQFFAGMFTDNAALVEYTAWAIGIYMAVVFSIAFQTTAQQSFLSMGQAKANLFIAVLRKFILLIPLIFILPIFFEDKVFAIFLAEPISDGIAAATAFILFLRFYRKNLQD